MRIAKHSSSFAGVGYIMILFGTLILVEICSVVKRVARSKEVDSVELELRPPLFRHGPQFPLQVSGETLVHFNGTSVRVPPIAFSRVLLEKVVISGGDSALRG